MSNRRDSAPFVLRVVGRWLRRRDDRRHRKMLATMLTPGQFSSQDMYQPGLRPARRPR